VRFLGGRAWKRLHRLAYPAFFFIVFHRFLMGETSESIIPFLEAFLLIGSYLTVKFLAWRPATFPWFQEIIVKVGIRYREYRAE
jgi:DMSO/TMAO reductase YedYZ heme-binding membrane subunit